MTDKIYWWNSPTKKRVDYDNESVPFSVVIDEHYFSGGTQADEPVNIEIAFHVISIQEFDEMPQGDISFNVYFRIQNDVSGAPLDITIATTVEKSEMELDDGHIICSSSANVDVPYYYVPDEHRDIDIIEYHNNPYASVPTNIYELSSGNGEVNFGENGFNMSFVIDGTKDSTKLQMYSYTKKEALIPNTVVWHENTNTWWVVSKDKVDRFESEGGYLYIHTLQLEGAIELLNFKDQTDCGFNANYYTIDEFIKRLISLSGFNSMDYEINYNGNIDENKIIDYVKTYENYTLLTALRDFLGGYNCDIKMYFTKDSNERLTGVVFDVISKTGNANTTKKSLSTSFNEIDEIRLIDKNSYGTSVITNAENVVATAPKTYPSVGSVKLTSDSDTVKQDNAMIRLPSPIYNVNWLKLCCEFKYVIDIYYANELYSSTRNYQHGNVAYNEKVMQLYYEYGIPAGIPSALKTQIINYIESKKPELFSIMEQITSITLYNCDRYDPTADNNAGNWVKPTEPQDFYFPLVYHQIDAVNHRLGKLALVPQEVKNTAREVLRKYLSIGWERGKNYIQGFDALAHNVNAQSKVYPTSYKYTDLRDDSYDNGENIASTTISSVQVKIHIIPPNQNNIRISNTSFIVNYVPMTDLKIKYDNKAQENISQLYNQNGKLTDAKGVSKLITSYLKEIESENITKYAEGYVFSSMPKVGEVYTNNNVDYIVNSASYNFYMNEQSGNNAYFIKGEYSLSKNVATKSILTNPNTNVRDYGIPQNYNVKRKQIYRDFYELSKNINGESDTDYYLTLDKVLNTSCYPKQLEHVAVIKAVYEEPTGGNSENNVDAKNTWYYQLDTTSYLLKKALYEVVDFKDNNIIGYSSLNTSSGFDISKLLTGMGDMVNTPVTYTDDNGRIKELDIAFCNIDQITKIYDDYIALKGITPNSSLYNASCFVDSIIYEGSDTMQHILVVDDAHTFSYVDYNETSAIIDITSLLPQEFIDYGNIEELDVLETQMWWSHGSGSDGHYFPETYELSFSKTGGRYYLNISFPASLHVNGDLEVYTNIYWNKQTLTGANINNDFIIKEPNYYKDGVEVPVFEYNCQIDDSDEVIIGENILNNDADDICNAYFFVLFDEDEIVNDNNISITLSDHISIYKQLKSGATSGSEIPSDYTYSFNSVGSLHQNAYILKLDFDSDITKLKMTNYEQVLLLDGLTETYRYSHSWGSSLEGKQMAVFRARINNKYTKLGTNVNHVEDTPIDFVMLIKNPSELINGDYEIDLSINHYNLK